ncbi:MAG TPA: hypothetical protein VKQ72_00650, partial [Aggregatilineales bacterium]|nr:hypothetical protein [Aggregatilineales bacterium]
RRSLVDDAVRALNGVQHGSDLSAARQAARSPLASGQLEAVEQAVHSVDEAIEYWALGEFRKARQCIDAAADRIAVAETILGRNFSPFKSWLQDLGASAEVCQQARRSIEQAALVPADDPNPLVAEAYHKIVEITRRDLGEQAAAGLREWRDTYSSIRDLYLDDNLNKAEKLKLYEGYASAKTFEQQPALPILRHWFGLMKRMPDRIIKLPFMNASSGDPAAYAPPSEIVEVPEEEAIKPIVREEESARPRPWYGTPITLGAGIIVAIALGATIGVLALQARNINGGLAYTPEGPTVPAAAFGGTPSPTPTSTETETPTPMPTFTEGPTSTPFTPPPTPTRAVPTYTPTGATSAPITLTPTNPSTLPPGSSPVPINPGIASPTFVPTAQSGDYDMLESLATLPTTKITWNKDWFGPGGDGWQLGIQTYRPNSPLLVVHLGPEVLTPLFGTDAARKLTRVDATLELVSYDKTLLPSGKVFYGFGLESTLGHRIAVQAALVQTSIARLSVNQDGVNHTKTEIPAATLKTQITIQRNPDGTATLSVNGSQIGQSGAFFSAGTPLGVYLYTSAGGVIVKVTKIEIHLD